MPAISVVCAVNDREVLCKNLLLSPLLGNTESCEFIEVTGHLSAGTAYNEGIRRARHDILVFAHQDVFLPQSWQRRFEGALAYLESVDPKWGVLGCWGQTQSGDAWGHVYSTGLGVIGDASRRPP